MPLRPDPSRHRPRAPHDPYFGEIDAVPLLDAAQERQLAYRIADGDRQAREHLVRANLRLVVAVARNYVGKGLELPDLIAEGNLGLLRAVEGFDPAMNTRFSTYASYWIRQSIQRALVNSGKAIRIPLYAAQLLTEWRRATVDLQERLGRAPTRDEVAAHLRLSPRKLAIVREALRVQRVTARGKGGEDRWSVLDTITDPSTEGSAGRAEGGDELRRVLELVGGLAERQASILRLRFGLGGEAPRTLAEVGELLGLTRERVRQLEKQALAELRGRMGPSAP
jgi:RNA polymerase primary sigma factor